MIKKTISYLIESEQELARWKGMYIPTKVEFSEAVIMLGAISFDEMDEPRASGILIGEVRDDYIELKWLYVDKKYRRKQVATTLLYQFLDAAKESYAINGIHMTVVDNDSGMTKFLKANGIDVVYDSIPGEYIVELKNSKLLGTVKNSNNIISFSEVTESALREFNQYLATHQGISCGERLPLVKSNYARESLAYVDNHNKLEAVVLLSVDMADQKLPVIIIRWVFCKTSPKALGLLFMQLQNILLSKYPQETVIITCTLNEHSDRLVRKLFPGAVKTRVCSIYVDINDYLYV